MAEKCIVPQEWEEYFDELYKKIKDMDEKVEIDIEAPSVFEEEEAKGIPILGISYDPKNKVLSVLSKDLEHLINKPQEICVEEENSGIIQIRATDGTGAEHFIKFSVPVK